jgi:hypothetical protein
MASARNFSLRRSSHAPGAITRVNPRLAVTNRPLDQAGDGPELCPGRSTRLRRNVGLVLRGWESCRYPDRGPEIAPIDQGSCCPGIGRIDQRQRRILARGTTGSYVPNVRGPKLPPRLRSALAGVLATLAVAACRKSPPTSDSPGSTSASASPSATVVSAGCREVTRGASFLVGEPGRTPRADDGEEPALPFAVELGGATVYAGGFAVAALRGQGGGTDSVVALVNAEASSGRIVSLGPSHGDANAPLAAARGDQLVMVVPGSDAGGQTLRLARLEDPQGRAAVVWGSEVPVGRDSQSFALELAEGAGLLVWDEVRKQHNVIRGAVFDPRDLSKPVELLTLSRPSDDAETPRLVARPGGYWLAFLTHRLPGAKAPPKDLPRPLPSAEDDGPEELLDLGPRWLELMPLDTHGMANAPARIISPEHSHVLVFDLAPGPGGGALLTWRDDRTTPGVEGGSVNLALASVDGSVERSMVEDDESGGGIPLLVVDETAPPSDFRAWLGVSSGTDATRLGQLGPTGRLLGELNTDPTVRGADLLAARNGRLLLARPRGLAQELSVVRCQLGSPSGASRRTGSSPPQDSAG